ncbi:MAG TPA: carboxy terminal-processing peptidase [Flavobacterium sp.]
MKLFPLLLLLLTSLHAHSQDGVWVCEKLKRISKLIDQEHFRPKPIDDSLSAFVFDSFIDGLDSYRNTITKREYDRLSRHRLKIDDQILNSDCAFFDEITAVYKTALERKLKILNKLKSQPIDYKLVDTLRFSRNNFPFDMKDHDQERTLRKRVKVEILEDISKMSDNLDSLQENFSSIEKTVREKIFETDLCKVTSVLEDKADFKIKLQNDFLNIFCSYFDPHSNYFTVDAKSNFMSMLSTSNLSLGLNFGLNEKNEIVIQEVIPGGPAAKTEEFEKNDVVVKVADRFGNGYMVSCSSLEAIGDMIYSDANKEMQITIRKKNGSLHEVFLRKQVMDATDNTVYSFIAEKETRVGYIKIPNFYSDFEGHESYGCADDVARHITALQKDNIQGIVIDLMDNGGGSMEEGLKLAGLFLDAGPISILSDNRERKTVLKDISPGTIYDGPLVVLVNGDSASASEFFASAMQDYKRGLILGSTTSGKATMQSILPLQRRDSPDYVKLTLQKFYRITGKSCQEIGITPDIIAPVLFDSIIQREKDLKNVLKNDTIKSKANFHGTASDFYQLRAMSNNRINSDSTFREISKINHEINQWYGIQKKPISLTLDQFFTDVHENDRLWKQVKKITSTPTKCVIRNNTEEIEKVESVGFLREVNYYKMKDAQTNPYLEEAINIITDYNRSKGMSTSTRH